MTGADDIARDNPRPSAARRMWDLLVQRGPSQVQFWLIAVVVGIVCGAAAVGFRLAVNWLQSAVYGLDRVSQVADPTAFLPWYKIIAIPLLGGLAVGVLLSWFTRDGRVDSVADVIEGAAVHDGRVQSRNGWASTLASLITLSTGGSSGREGPVVHLAGLISTKVSRAIKANGVTGRNLLGCGVAAAVSASFNAPIAGAIFALEVVLRHFAVTAFAPIAIASVAGTVVARLILGDVPEFDLPVQPVVEFYAELPAFLLLGILCGLIAVTLVKFLQWSDLTLSALQARIRLPGYLRPALTGAALGVIAIWFPHVIGVGYQTTMRALSGDLFMTQAIVFAIVKMLAVALTFGGRMGGGIFSPSLMLGALGGLAFGTIATTFLPGFSDNASVYALAGMGAVAAGVLGAPISTILIVFEMTGDWQTGLAVMVTVSLASATSIHWITKSYFLSTLEKRGLDLVSRKQSYHLSLLRADTLMRAIDHPRGADPQECWRMIERGDYLGNAATLQQAWPIFERINAAFIPVLRLRGEDRAPELWGALFYVDALKAYNRALTESAAEEHS